MPGILDHEALALLRELLEVPSPSGREERMGALVRRKAEALGYETQTDPCGNVVVGLAGKEHDLPPIIVAAHLDEIAMVVTGIEPDGKLRVDRSGGLFPAKAGECVVDILGDVRTIPGVLSMGSMHVADAGNRNVGWSDVRLITGYSPERLEEIGVRVGSTAVPNWAGRGPVILGDGPDPLVGAWTFDDRGGVLTLLRLLKRFQERKITPKRHTLIAFTVHEEGGCQGAKTLAQRERPEIFLAIDGCPIIPGSAIAVDGRPATWSMDLKCHYDQRLVRQVMACGRDVGTQVQSAAFTAGAYSDASAVYDAGAAPRVAVLGHPRENSHGFEVVRLSVFDNVLNVLSRLLEVIE